MSTRKSREQREREGESIIPAVRCNIPPPCLSVGVIETEEVVEQVWVVYNYN